MENARVKGELFQKLINYINKKWGANGLEKIDVDMGEYLPDAWYGLDVFCDLIDSLYGRLDIHDPQEPFKIGKWIVTNNLRWVATFHGQDPANVFMSNKNQELEYIVGEFKAAFTQGKEVSLHSTIWTRNERHLDIWSEFYQGRLQGVLDLTGRNGQVTKISKMMVDQATVTYLITWT